MLQFGGVVEGKTSCILCPEAHCCNAGALRFTSQWSLWFVSYGCMSFKQCYQLDEMPVGDFLTNFFDCFRKLCSPCFEEFKLRSACCLGFIYLFNSFE